MPRRSTLPSRLARYWSYKDEPEGQVPLEVLHTVRRLARNPEAGAPLLSFAWNLLEGMYTNLGWNIPTEPELARCCSAAQSSAHACRLAAEDLLSELSSWSGPTTVLGALTFSERLFRRWDMIPPVATVIVPLDDSDAEPVSASTLRASRGIWHASPGLLREDLAAGVPSTAFEPALLPTPAVILAMTARPALAGDDTSALFFCAALRACSKLDAWDHAWEVAALAGARDHLIMAAHKHGLRLPVPKRVSLRFRLLHLLTGFNRRAAGV